MRHLITALITVVSSVLSTASVHADLGDQLFELLPDDGAAGDLFGRSVAISGTTAIVGAYKDNDNGAESGSAYLFDTTTGKQLFKILPSDGAKGDRFGQSVAIGGLIGNEVGIIGAWLDDDSGLDSGSAYLFDITTHQQLFKLLADDGAEFDEFGISVAISGTTAIVGAYLNDDNGYKSGSAYLFDTTTGHQLYKLLPNDGAFEDRFGISVAISGGIAIVGADRGDNNGTESGSAYLFDTTTGLQLFKLLPNDISMYLDLFGASVAINGATAIVGALGDDDNGLSSGSAYLFDTISGEQIAKLLPCDGASGDRFGASVAISGTTAIIGAYRQDDNGKWSGSAYLFDTTTEQQIAKLLPNDGAFEDVFGKSVAIGGPLGQKTAIVAAVGHDDNGSNSGSAYLFDATATTGNCPWDLDSSGAVGISDLLALFAQWGGPGTADFDESGSVGINDMLILFANWGPCK